MQLEDDSPGSLKDPEAIELRRKLRFAPHVAPLTAFAASLRTRPNVKVPDFDPLDGGVNAKILFLFEKPGPMTDALREGQRGSGFVSRNNNDPTAKATLHFMKVAAIPRRDTLIWNVIPWWDGHIKFSAPDLEAALPELDRLLSLLPQLRSVVFVGRTAAKASPHLRSQEAMRLRLYESAHPSPKVKHMHRERWCAIPGIWRDAGASLGTSPCRADIEAPPEAGKLTPP